MPDVFDQAQETEAMFLEQSKQAREIKAASVPKLLPIGRCLSNLCCLEFDPGSRKLFCGPSCAADFQKYQG